MTFSSAPQSTPQAQLRGSEIDVRGASLTQSRETGEIYPEGRLNGLSVVRGDTPVVKPWAHFVAGGFVRPSLDFWTGKY